LAPYSGTARYNLACAHALTGHADDALRILGALVDGGASFDIASDEDLASLKQLDGFHDIERRMEALQRPVGTSELAFTLPEHDLITEGVAHDPGSGAFFVSSVRKRKVVRMARDARPLDFLTSGQDGLYSVIGLAVDVKRRRLWLSSAATPVMEGFQKADDGKSFVAAYDLGKARRIRRIEPPAGIAGAQFSDVTLAADGTLYVADPITGRIYAIGADADSARVLVDAGPLYSAQGLTFCDEGGELFVADYVQGIARVEVSSGAATLLSAPEGSILNGIDGLVCAQGSLVGIQNGVRPHKVLRLRLSPKRDRIEQVDLLERANPHFDEPTLATLVNGDVYYVANSQYGKVNADGTLKPGLKPPAILRLHLE
jgi:sugar lactone lactonase YvrE